MLTRVFTAIGLFLTAIGRFLTAIGLFLVLLPIVGFAQESSCDRTCLEGFVDRYLEAMIAHDPSLIPVTRDVRMTENGQRLELGDGLWRSMVGRGTYRLFVTDVDAGQVAFIGTIREDPNRPTALALRLRVENLQISEIEVFVVSSEDAVAGMEGLGQPNPLFLETIPASERMSRAELIRVANMYFAGMEQNDGLGTYPFTDDCDRFENGGRSTNVPPRPGEPRADPATANMYSSQWSCRVQFESGLIHFVNRIRDRRYVAVDRERGLVFSFVFFDHSGGETRTYQTPSGRTVTAGPTDPWTWEIAEMFRIENGLIHRIEAVLERAPYGMPSGWSTWEEGMSSLPRDVTMD